MSEGCGWVGWTVDAWYWIPSAGWASVCASEGSVWVAVTDTALAAGVTWMTTLMMASISTFDVNCGGGVEGA